MKMTIIEKIFRYIGVLVAIACNIVLLYVCIWWFVKIARSFTLTDINWGLTSINILIVVMHVIIIVFIFVGWFAVLRDEDFKKSWKNI